MAKENELDYKLNTLSDRQFSDWQALIQDKTGIILPNDQRYFLQSSITIRMQEISCESHEAYFERLLSDIFGTVEWAILVDRLTISETNFFNHLTSFTLIKNYLRQLIIRYSKNNQVLNLWNVGCSTGETSYTLLILIEELLSELQLDLYYGITATDISLPALSTARKGEYHESRLSGLSEHQKNLLFDKLTDKHYRVKHNHKNNICFTRANLLEMNNVPISNLDVILCQNLLTYFPQDYSHRILNHFINSSNVGGLMVFGLGDIVNWCPPTVRKIKVPEVLAYTKNIK